MTPFAFRAIPAAALLLASAVASADPSAMLTFSGAIGVDPLTGAGAPGSPVDVVNTVRGINPGGRAWVIRKFSATVYSDSSIVARGKGLLFSSGEVIATRGPVAAVGATLTCGAADATAARYSAGPVPLDTAGNFVIRGFLSQDGVNTAVLPATCANPQLLVGAWNAAEHRVGAWFAAGIQGDDD